MSKQHATAVPAVVNTPQPRCSERARRATKRFEEGWFGARLPSLSLALGFGPPEPRHSERERKATQRFAEGWFGDRLPKLSSALGVAEAEGRDGLRRGR